jgi:hypothetical protein
VAAALVVAGAVVVSKRRSVAIGDVDEQPAEEVPVS